MSDATWNHVRSMVSITAWVCTQMMKVDAGMAAWIQTHPHTSPQQHLTPPQAA